MVTGTRKAGLQEHFQKHPSLLWSSATHKEQHIGKWSADTREFLFSVFSLYFKTQRSAEGQEPWKDSPRSSQEKDKPLTFQRTDTDHGKDANTCPGWQRKGRVLNSLTLSKQSQSLKNHRMGLLTCVEFPTSLSLPSSLVQIGALFCGVCIPNIFCTCPASLFSSIPSWLSLVWASAEAPPALCAPLLHGRVYCLMVLMQMWCSCPELLMSIKFKFYMWPPEISAQVTLSGVYLTKEIHIF